MKILLDNYKEKEVTLQNAKELVETKLNGILSFSFGIILWLYKCFYHFFCHNYMKSNFSVVYFIIIVFLFR